MGKGIFPRSQFDSIFSPSVTSSNSIRYHVDKPIVRTPRPQDFNQWLDQYVSPKRPKNKSLDLVSSLATHRKWTSTAESAMQDSALPITRRLTVPATTREEVADPVRSSRGRLIHESSPMLWQEVGRKWDSVQRREPILHCGQGLKYV